MIAPAAPPYPPTPAWPFPSAVPPKRWTPEQEEAYAKEQRDKIPPALM